MKHKLIIAGGRDFNDYELLQNSILPLLPSIGEIVSGTCRGADLLGERFANKHNIPIKQFPANWNLYGKSAGPRRNAQMAAYADICIVFWDGTSRGTKNMIDTAIKYKLPIKVIKY